MEKSKYPLVTVFGVGMAILVRPLQPEKASSPMLVRLLGRVIPTRLLQPEKALSPILVKVLSERSRQIYLLGLSLRAFKRFSILATFTIRVWGVLAELSGS